MHVDSMWHACCWSTLVMIRKLISKRKDFSTQFETSAEMCCRQLYCNAHGPNGQRNSASSLDPGELIIIQTKPQLTTRVYPKSTIYSVHSVMQRIQFFIKQSQGRGGDGLLSAPRVVKQWCYFGEHDRFVNRLECFPFQSPLEQYDWISFDCPTPVSI